MVKDWVETLKTIIRLSGAVEKRLERIVKLSGVVGYLEDYIECDPYYSDCYHVSYGEWIERLKDWVYLYERVSETREPRLILYELPYKFNARVNYSELRLLQICRKESLVDCIVVDKPLPLDNEAKEKILSEAKKKIEEMMEHMPIELAKLVLTLLVEILPSMKHEIQHLRDDYKRLQQQIEEVKA